MIFVITRRNHAYTVRPFLETWGRAIAGQVRLLSYESLAALPRLENGDAVVFADIERLPPSGRRLAARLYRSIRRGSADVLVLNDPVRVLDRAALLRTLFEKGINSFAVYELSQYREVRRFPVFIRNASDHRGSLTPLLHNRAELDSAVDALARQPSTRWRDLIITEYVDVSKDGLFAKYSVMRLHDRLIPRHVLYSREWVTKKPKVIDAELAAEEARFVDEFPDQETVREVFELANIEYGRIDYGYHDGQLCVWEINTNGVVAPGQANLAPERLASQSKSVAQIVAGLRALSPETNGPRDGRCHSLSGALLSFALRARSRMKRYRLL